MQEQLRQIRYYRERSELPGERTRARVPLYGGRVIILSVHFCYLGTGGAGPVAVVRGARGCPPAIQSVHPPADLARRPPGDPWGPPRPLARGPSDPTRRRDGLPWSRPPHLARHGGPPEPAGELDAVQLLSDRLQLVDDLVQLAGGGTVGQTIWYRSAPRAIPVQQLLDDHGGLSDQLSTRWGAARSRCWTCIWIWYGPDRVSAPPPVGRLSLGRRNMDPRATH